MSDPCVSLKPLVKSLVSALLTYRDRIFSYFSFTGVGKLILAALSMTPVKYLSDSLSVVSLTPAKN
jgi:hypothetical protein